MRRAHRVATIAVALACLILAGSSAAIAPAPDAGAAPAVRVRPELHTASGSRPAAMAAASRPAPVGVPSAGPVSSQAPMRVVIASIGVDSALERLPLLANGTIGAPSSYAEAGWFDAGPVPGQAGPAVIAGHVDSRTGPGVFAHLDRLRPGDLVEVIAGDGAVLVFRVTGTSLVAKDDFPAAAVYGPVPDPELRLITCGGSFDYRAGHYRANLVVDAVLAG